MRKTTLSSLIVLLIITASVANARADDGAREPPAVELVDINSASVEELTKLPGIGPAKARAIVEYRSRRRFLSPAAIQRVKGIGRSTYLRLRHLITVGNR
jgi:competence protein ComEA